VDRSLDPIDRELAFTFLFSIDPPFIVRALWAIIVVGLAGQVSAALCVLSIHVGVSVQFS
jgi:hypothetical protein